MVENKITERRHELGMTLEQLSKASDVPVSTLGEVEKGREPGVKSAQRISRAINKTIDELWPD